MPRALLVLLSGAWMGVTRLPAALVRAGWQVASLCPPECYLAHSRYAGRLELFNQSEYALADLAKAVNEFRPDVLIPGCEATVRWFQRIALASSDQTLSEKTRVMQSCVRKALGHVKTYDATLSKTMLQKAAGELGLRVPAQQPARGVQEALVAASQIGYPIVLKGEHGFAGHQVRICETESALLRGYQALASAGKGQHIDAQQYICGDIAMCAGVAHEGRLLNSVFALKLETYPLPTSPCSVLQYADCPKASQMLSALVRHFGFNGFCSCDYILEAETNLVYLLEFNPRPVPLTALGHLNAHDLCLSYAHVFDQKPLAAETQPERQSVVALFPNEWLRDAQSSYLSNAYHDVPWDDPPLLRALQKGSLQKGSGLAIMHQ